MADIDIASPGAQSDALKAALRDLVGESFESSGSAPSAVTSFVIPVPSVGEAFRLDMRGVRMSVAGQLAGVFSFDGGVTYYYSASALDRYSDRVMFIPFETVQAFDMTLQIRPGGGGGSPPDIARLAFINTVCFYPQGFSSKVDQDGLNPTAAIPPPTTRMTHIAFFPYGNADYPPTSGQTITCDSWQIFRLR